jgi:hypothetical protein
MRLSFPSFLSLLLLVVGLVQARSAVGNRILVVLEDGGEKNLYSQFWADLECKFSTGLPAGMWRLLTVDV